MSKLHFMAVACVAVALPAVAGLPDPADPALPVAQAPDLSAFADYRPLREVTLLDWRAANAALLSGEPVRQDAIPPQEAAPERAMHHRDHHH